ncbi:hypothetical protein [Burkholderia gladioli]|uniref:hypothetical protein n=1 Tax=Burkholderia gladioli TaxID=28095 RepID=UPI00164118A3|nr:hypothetical protein [Burkholderia gladioli]
MSRPIVLKINGNPILVNEEESRPIVIREDDKLCVGVRVGNAEEAPEVFFEDFRASLFERTDDTGALFFETPTSPFFSESFGFASLRVQFADSSVTIAFDVMARKTSADQARKMITYLATHSESLIRTCFARSTLPSGSQPLGVADPETLLSCAESFMESLQASRLELVNNPRERLVPARTPFWEASSSNYEVDPYDVLANLDALTPSITAEDVCVRGKHFALGGLDVSNLMATADVKENRILLGGVYSIRNRVGALLSELEDMGDLNVDAGNGGSYESFSRLMLSLTADSMIYRCSEVIYAATEFIKLLEVRLGVTFNGEIRPMMTPYARSSRLYRTLFTQLYEWYELGEPALEGLKFLMKLRSLSKIYELFTLFHLMQYFVDEQWSLVSATAHPELGTYVPSTVDFSLGELKLTLSYEPVINIWDVDCDDQSLVDVHHSPGWKNPYWTPDFVLRFALGTVVRYVILDAKYSTAGSVKEFHIPALFEKYFLGMAVYDKAAGITTSSSITGVMAVYSLDTRTASYISHWRRQGPSVRVPRVPMIGGFGLMVDNDSLFKETLRSMISVTRATMR